MNYLVEFLIAGIVFAVIDGLWLGIVAKNFYRKEIGAIMLVKPRLLAAVKFYIIYIIGLVVFALHPALAQESWESALALGALFGFVAYSTYDLTNLATLKKWTKRMTIVDIAWGTVLTGLVTLVSYLILHG